MYHDAKNESYSAHKFYFFAPSAICSFIKYNDVMDRNTAVRSIHLKVVIYNTAYKRN